MNILQIINAKWWNAEAAYAYSLSKGLVRAGHKVCILGLTGKPVLKKAAKDEILTFETEGLNSANPLKICHAIKTIGRIIEREEIDLINCHKSDGFPLVVLAAKLSSRRPALIRTRGDQRPVRRGMLNRILYKQLADGIIASGEAVKSVLVERLNLAPERVAVIRAAVDTETFRPMEKFSDMREELEIEEGAPLVAILGRVSEVKGHKYFIEATPLILKDCPATRFLFIVKEDDPNIAPLKKQISEAGLADKIFFIGYRDDLVDVMASCDIGAVTSIGSETNCRVALEWMAMAKPVIGTTIGVIPEVIRDGKTGLLIPPRDHEAIASAMTKLLGDERMRGNFGKAGRKLVEDEYSEPLFTERTLEVYGKALKKRKGNE